MIKAALFDVDGTLIDSNDLHADAWRAAFAEFGHDVSFEAARGQIGKGGDNLIPALVPGLPEEEAAALEAYRSEIFQRDYLPRVVPFPGVRALFERLAADGVKIVLASSAKADEVHFHLGVLGCEDLVAGTTSADDAQNSKPDPDIFAAALASVAPVSAADAIVIGDSPFDMEAAAKLGIRTIGFRSGGFADDVLLGAGASALYDGPEHLLREYGSSAFAR
jgi:HAD superfamily hydrolase (TIGR01509 family)